MDGINLLFIVWRVNRKNDEIIVSSTYTAIDRYRKIQNFERLSAEGKQTSSNIAICFVRVQHNYTTRI